MYSAEASALGCDTASEDRIHLLREGIQVWWDLGSWPARLGLAGLRLGLNVTAELGHLGGGTR